jgi:hypothetical protein
VLADNNLSRPFAEIVESSLGYFIAQSWQWNCFPRFGSLVQVFCDDFILLGCVGSIQTGSMDPMRYPFPYQKTEEELKAEQPHIFEFLKTVFTVVNLGYMNVESNFEEEKIFYSLPPKPSKIHAFVQTAIIDVQERFLIDSNFLHVLFSGSHNVTNVDELIIAIITMLKKSEILNKFKMDIFCKTFSLLTGNDYRRLKILLQRIDRI